MKAWISNVDSPLRIGFCDSEEFGYIWGRQQKERIRKDVRYQGARGVTFDCEFTTHN